MPSFFVGTPNSHRTSHLMFDLETGGRKAGCKILSIGACIFDPRALSRAVELQQFSFYANIDPDSQPDLQWDPDTVAWWADQDPAAKAALQTNQRPLRDVGQDFLLWLSNHPFHISGYWANSPSFDKVIWEHALETVGLRWPLAFWMERDVRTAKDFAFPDGDAPQLNGGVKHNALDDAIAQAQLVQLCHARIRLPQGSSE